MPRLGPAAATLPEPTCGSSSARPISVPIRPNAGNSLPSVKSTARALSPSAAARRASPRSASRSSSPSAYSRLRSIAMRRNGSFSSRAARSSAGPPSTRKMRARRFRLAIAASVPPSSSLGRRAQQRGDVQPAARQTLPREGQRGDGERAADGDQHRERIEQAANGSEADRERQHEQHQQGPGCPARQAFERGSLHAALALQHPCRARRHAADATLLPRPRLAAGKGCPPAALPAAAARARGGCRGPCATPGRFASAMRCAGSSAGSSRTSCRPARLPQVDHDRRQQVHEDLGRLLGDRHQREQRHVRAAQPSARTACSSGGAYPGTKSAGSTTAKPSSGSSTQSIHLNGEPGRESRSTKRCASGKPIRPGSSVKMRSSGTAKLPKRCDSTATAGGAARRAGGGSAVSAACQAHTPPRGRPRR